MKHDCITTLVDAGISHQDATALRRISMTLHRWHELECGDSNDYASWCITRGRKPGRDCTFEHDDNGKPFIERHSHHVTSAQYVEIPDRERGALKRLATIMTRYPGFTSYVQGDPRGASLYIMRPDDIPAGQDVSNFYNRGIAVFK